MSDDHKQHTPSKDSEQAMHEADAHSRKINSHDAVPGDDTAHAHSHAAHRESNFDEHVAPQGNAPSGVPPDMREPAQEISSTGKMNRN